MSRTFSEGADAHWSPCPGMWILLWQEHRDTPAGGGFWGQCLCPRTHRHRSVPLCLTQCHPLCLTCFPQNPPGIPPAPPAPGLILTAHSGNVGGFQNHKLGRFEGNLWSLVTVGNGKQGFCQAEGCRGLGWLCLWCQENAAFPLDKGSCAPGARSICGWVGVSRSWRLLEREQRVLTPYLWAGKPGGAGPPVGLMPMLRVCQIWGSPIPRALSPPPPPPSCLPAPVFPGQVARGLYNVLKPRNSSSRYTTTQPATGGGRGGDSQLDAPPALAVTPLCLQCSAPGVVHQDRVPVGEGDLIVTVIPLLLHVLNNCFYL